MIYRILRKGEVRVNKKRVKPEYKLEAGDESVSRRCARGGSVKKRRYRRTLQKVAALSEVIPL